MTNPAKLFSLAGPVIQLKTSSMRAFEVAELLPNRRRSLNRSSFDLRTLYSQVNVEAFKQYT